MESKDLSNKLIEVVIDGKLYALVPLCTFHDIPDSYETMEFRSTKVENQFGLRDTINTMNLYEVTDPKKVMLAKIKYGI